MFNASVVGINVNLVNELRATSRPNRDKHLSRILLMRGQRISTSLINRPDSKLVGKSIEVIEARLGRDIDGDGNSRPNGTVIWITEPACHDGGKLEFTIHVKDLLARLLYDNFRDRTPDTALACPVRVRVH